MDQLALSGLAAAQTTPAIPAAITTPDKVQTRLGTLEFKDGMPSKDTVDKVYDNLDFAHAVEAFLNTMQGVSIHALRKGFLSIAVKDNEVLVFSELMDAKSLFLTANVVRLWRSQMLRTLVGEIPTLCSKKGLWIGLTYTRSLAVSHPGPTAPVR